jgi:hypothetical protein
MLSSKRLALGQTALIVILFIIILALTGTTWHLHALQDDNKKNIEKSQKPAGPVIDVKVEPVVPDITKTKK